MPNDTATASWLPMAALLVRDYRELRGSYDPRERLQAERGIVEYVERYRSDSAHLARAALAYERWPSLCRDLTVAEATALSRESLKTVRAYLDQYGADALVASLRSRRALRAQLVGAAT